MKRNVVASAPVHQLASALRRGSLLRRAAPIWLGLLVTVGSAIPPATPGPIPLLPKIPVALAGYPCSSHTGEWTTFTGHLSNSSGTQLSESTTGDVYGRISNVDRSWQPSPGCGYYRYDSILWATTNDASHLRVDWGALSGDAQACLYFVNTADYIHANSGACPGSPTTARLVATLTPAAAYHNDTAFNTTGDFGFAHSDCITWYGSELILTGISTATTSGEPGANCGNKQIDATGTTQTLVMDGTAPTTSFSFPAAGGPVLVPSAFAGVTFSATDAIAGFGGADDWDLQRQVATWSGAACGTYANDSGANALVSGTTNAANQVSSQGLALNNRYRWTLAARDQNGNTASTITSGSIRTDTSGVWGDQPQFRIESWDLGSGDSVGVSTGSGNLRATHPIVSLPIVGGTFDLVASYDSHDTASVGVGPGWRLNVQRRLAVNGDGSVTFTDSDGSRHTFTNPTGSPTVTYTRPATLYATLTRDTAATPDRFTLTYRDLSVDVFDEDIAGTGLLKQVKDRNGNTVSIAYSTADKISTITDPSSRVIAFTWTGSNLTQIVDWANVSGGIIQASGTGNRTHRFFYDGSNYLIGWADPLNTSGSCPTAGSHLTCLTYTAGLLSAIAKTQTYETISGNPGTLASATRTITTSIAYTFADVASVTDVEGAATAFSHPASGGTKVVRPGTPASDITYALLSATDTDGRIGSVKRKLASAQIETATTYDTTYSIEPATLTEDKAGSLQRVTNYTYQASSLALLARLDEPLDGTYRRYTDFTYNANNDITQKIVSRQGDATLRTTTRYCFTSSGCSTSATDLLLRSQIDNYVDGTAGGTNGHVEDVTTTYAYDGYGQRTRSTRANYSGGTLLDSAATGWTYDTFGNLTVEIRNYADGTVTNPGDDVIPNATTNARTDLMSAYTYDTAGNRVSSADPRRAIKTALGISLSADDYISRTVNDALNQAVTTRLPTALDIGGQSDCSPTPTCREATNTYDELGAVREAADIADLVTSTKYDKAGRALEAYESVSYPSASITAINTYDAQGRLLTSKDREQAKTGSALGYTQFAYDELGRTIAQAWAVTTGAATETDYGYDSLDRRTSMVTGVADTTAQATIWTYDTGGRVTKVDDEFTCTSTSYGYRDLATQVIEGQASGACSGGGIRTVTNTYDGLGRQTLSQVTAGTGLNDKLAETIHDSAGNTLSSSATRAGATTSTTFTINQLDQPTVEVRSNGTWAKTNYDPAGGATDRCLWSASPTDPCKPVGSTFANPQPTSVTTTTYDGRNQRIILQDAVANTTTTYTPDHNYQISSIYLLTGNGREHQTRYGYDARHRVISITQVLCAIAEHPVCTGANILATTASDTYAYDDNDNKTGVTESNAAGTLTRGYCYDAVQRVTSTRDATGCTGNSLEAYTYDDSGNRKTAGSTTFTYDAEGQLASCSSGCGTIAYDAAGRTQKWNGWAFEYDAQGRMTRACQSSTDCTGLYNEVEYTYDGEGHRTQIKTYASGSATPVTTWDFRYQGEAIVEEKVTDAAHPSGTVVRSYVVDDSGAIVKLTIPSGEPGAGTYLVTWSGHGDALGLLRIEADGSLTLANSYTYSTWGTPTTTVAPGFTDLGFRFLYVGQSDVQWDNANGLGLYYMHARHYSAALGRFLQPDPDSSESNLYAYAANNPVTEMDPSGTCFIICAIVNAVLSVAIYAVTTDSSQWNWADAGREAVVGFGTGLIGVGLLDKLSEVGRIASAISRVTSAVTRGAAAASRSGRIGAAVVRQATRAVRFVIRDQRMDWIRFGRTKVPPSVSGRSGYVRSWAIRSGGPTKTGFTFPWHVHIHMFNLFNPSRWNM